MITIRLTERQENIIKIVKEEGPIKGEEIAEKLGIIWATIRPDLSFLTKSSLLEARPRVGYYFTEKILTNQITEEIKRIKVKDMKSVPAVVSDKCTVYDAIVELFLQDVGSLFIVSAGGLLEGIVSRKDLLKIAMGQIDTHKVPVTVIMTRKPNIITIEGDDTLLSAARKLVEHEIDSLPVVRPVNYEGQEGLEVVGRITKTTITRAFYELGLGRFIIQGGDKS